MASSGTASAASLSYAERVRKAQKMRAQEHPGAPIVNVWSQRMAAARNLPPATSTSTAPSAASSTDPDVIDERSWPEVGKSLQDESAPNHDHPSPRKSEKTKSKWVAIPAQELQAAADALESQRRKSCRRQSKHRSAPGSASQSRSESLQSSPLFPRGRRLDDNPSRPRSPPPRFASQHPSTSRPRSPPLVVQPHLAPPPQPIPIYTYNNPYGPASPPSLAYPVSPPPGPYSPLFSYPLPLWYSNLGPLQHWNPNSQPGSGQHSPRYPNPPNIRHIPRQPHNQRINSHTAEMTQLHSTQRQNTTHVGPLPPAISLPVTVSAIAPTYVNGLAQAPTFGTINSDRSPSPSLVPNSMQTDQDEPKPFTQFTIGVAPGDKLAHRSRSRTHSQTSSYSHHSGKRSRTTTGEEKIGLAEVSENGEEGGKVLDLTGGKVASEARYAFGSVEAGEGKTSPQVDATILSSMSISPPQNMVNVVQDTGGDTGQVTRDQPPAHSSPSELHKRLEQLVLKEGEDKGHNPFEVQDYGFGFGSHDSSGGSSQDQPQMEQQMQSDFVSSVSEPERVYAPRQNKREGPSRRGGYHNQGIGHEGRAYPPRRGRGNYLGNGYGRGGFAHRRNGSGYQHQQQHMHVRPPPPFSVTPPFDPVAAAGGFYAGHPMMGMNMNGIGMNGMYHDGIGYPPIPMPQPAPVPAPVTQLPFLDRTRWYLLGQLEYYLSAQNMAQDYFLRRRMDSKGWVPISLIASFKRVRQLTEDEALVREVLMLSSVVEVKDAWVRMKDWRTFVLPDAHASSVYEDDTTWNGDQDGAAYIGQAAQIPMEKRPEEQGDLDVDDDDEDEDDVVFVLTRDEDAKIPWPAEKHT